MRPNLSCRRVETRGKAPEMASAGAAFRSRVSKRGGSRGQDQGMVLFPSALSPYFVTGGVIHSSLTSSAGSTSRASASLRMVRG